MDRNAIQPRPDQPTSRIETHPAPESDQEYLGHQIRRRLGGEPPGDIAVDLIGVTLEQPAEMDRRRLRHGDQRGRAAWRHQQAS
jgi:hypothetical protein